MVGEPVPGQGGAEAQAVPPAKEGEQTTQEQLRALIEDLTQQDEALGGNLLVKMPLSPEDPRNALFFQVSESKANGPNARMTYGVHPDKGPIYVLERSQGSRMPLSAGISEYRVGVRRFEDGLRSILYNEDQIGLVNRDDRFGEWQQSYEASKVRAERIMQEEAAKRQFLPKALEVVRGGAAPPESTPRT